MPFELFAYLGRLDEAWRREREYLERFGPSLRDDPFAKVAEDFACGTTTYKALLDAAVQHEDRVFARYLIGLTHLANGDRTGAIQEFETVEREDNFALSRWTKWAHLFLHRLRQDSAWPPWIPLNPPAAPLAE